MSKTPPIFTELYKGRVVVKFFPDSHQYWVSIDGGPSKRKTGVTSLNIMDKSKALMSWQQGITLDKLLEFVNEEVEIDKEKAIEACVQNELYLKEATAIGNEAHEWFEFYIRNKTGQKGFEDLPDIPEIPEVLTAVNAFMDWEKKHKVKFISTETMVYSLEHDYIGTEDFVAEIDGKLCDGDFKTSNGLYNGVRMQTAAYAKARMEAGGKKTKGRWAIRLPKYTEAEYIAREERKQEIRNIINKVMGREQKDYPIKPYEAFEAKFLDDKKTHLERDFEAFLKNQWLHKWDKETNPFYNGKDW